jgi:hypothetical protein
MAVIILRKDTQEKNLVRFRNFNEYLIAGAGGQFSGMPVRNARDHQ